MRGLSDMIENRDSSSAATLFTIAVQFCIPDQRHVAKGFGSKQMNTDLAVDACPKLS